ncbi:transcriptional regulatory protein OmpR [Clostridium homopropionicum DSM 5847]|uniref:Stage 0 sporulation protein A homolog n=1 Tax=Clostridium homopropionicum DSM 5847 TaxID=1121318 RepID=A0A0L6Z7T5_9CLOT|nr:response regulator [Clostridium homopropionicum]KOA19030.1 transcriptional regulatory protein OmpR [Clostridium homopropionicum DSM 5847]SFG91290.1 Response regulator receiver domain-containing protein [Clostridium homopropionicum]
MRNIIILDNKAYIRSKVKEIVSDYDINVYEAINSIQFFNTLAELNYKVDLIITELNLGNESGIEIIKRLKSKGVNIPILIVTTENRKREFAKSIMAGAVDYILKPFDEKLLLKRIVGDIEKGKTIKKANTSQAEAAKETNIKGAADIKKDNEESKNISICMITIFKTVEEFTSDIEKEYENLTNILYPYVKKILKKDEGILRLGLQSFCASFYDISERTKEEVTHNINLLFSSLKEKNHLFKDIFIACVFTDYPKDGNDKKELIIKAKDITVEKINEVKKMEKR